MIRTIPHKEEKHASFIKSVFQVSYKVEAQMLKATNFPPLSRKLDSFMSSVNDFFGYYEEDTLVAVIEIKDELTHKHIQSLVVDPNHFRKGIGRKLVEYILTKHNTNLFTVETGKENKPARSLYESFGFELLKTYTAAENIVKVRYQKQAI